MRIKLAASLTFGKFDRLRPTQTERTGGSSFLDMLLHQKGQNLYVALYKQHPNGWLEELHYPKYKRVEVPRDRTAWMPFQKVNGGFLIANKEWLNFPVVTEKATMATHAAICLENGRAVASGQLDIPAILTVGSVPVFQNFKLNIAL